MAAAARTSAAEYLPNGCTCTTCGGDRSLRGRDQGPCNSGCDSGMAEEGPGRCNTAWLLLDNCGPAGDRCAAMTCYMQACCAAESEASTNSEVVMQKERQRTRQLPAVRVPVLSKSTVRARPRASSDMAPRTSTPAYVHPENQVA